MFRNLRVYRLPTSWRPRFEQFQLQAFTPCGASDRASTGFVPPRHGLDLLHCFAPGQYIATLATEVKVLVPDAIERATQARCAELEEQQGFRVGRKQRKEVKESVIDEFLPKAQTRMTKTSAWLDCSHGWMVIDAASQSRAEDVLKLFIKAIDKFPLESWHPLQSPRAAMTEWLAADEAPGGFTIDQNAVLQGVSEAKPRISFKNLTLDPVLLRRHISEGKHCIQLAMTWADRISFVLDESLAIKRVTPLDVLKEDGRGEAKDADERWTGDMMLMAGEYAKLLADLNLALGGEQPRKEGA